jgi:hypothetical protein
MPRSPYVEYGSLEFMKLQLGRLHPNSSVLITKTAQVQFLFIRTLVVIASEARQSSARYTGSQFSSFLVVWPYVNFS